MTDDNEWERRLALARARVAANEPAPDEITDDKATARLRRFVPAFRAALVPCLPPPSRIPKATRQRAAVDAASWDDDRTAPHVYSPVLLDLCRD